MALLACLCQVVLASLGTSLGCSESCKRGCTPASKGILSLIMEAWRYCVDQRQSTCAVHRAPCQALHSCCLASRVHCRQTSPALTHCCVCNVQSTAFRPRGVDDMIQDKKLSGASMRRTLGWFQRMCLGIG